VLLQAKELEDFVPDAQRGGATQSSHSSERAFGQICLLILGRLHSSSDAEKRAQIVALAPAIRRTSILPKNPNTGLTQKQ
jgi:hypothetical protein